MHQVAYMQWHFRSNSNAIYSFCTLLILLLYSSYTPFMKKKTAPSSKKSLIGQSRLFPVCYACMRCQVRMASMSCIRLRTPSFVKI